MTSEERAALVLAIHECVEVVVECCNCGQRIADNSLETYELAEQALERGWTYNDESGVVCPNCTEAHIRCAQCGTNKSIAKSKFARTLDNGEWVCSKKCHREYALDYFNYDGERS
jgi:hypothetical protein